MINNNLYYIIFDDTAFSNGLEIKGTMVYFKNIGYNDLGNALKSVKSLINRKKYENSKNKTQFINTLFPRNLDDTINLGGLLQIKHPCRININEIFHKDWYQESLIKFKFEPLVVVNNDNDDDDNKEMMVQYYKHLKTMNKDIWNWYHSIIPTQDYMNKVNKFLNEYLLIMIHKTLKLPNNQSTNSDAMMSIFGSISYGLFINKISDIDIGININVKKKNKQKKDNKNNKIKFLQLLSSKIKVNNKNIFDKKSSNKKNKKSIKKPKVNKHVKYNKKMKKLEMELMLKHKEKKEIVINEERFDVRVPILKIYVRNLKLSMDISINNESNLVSKLIMLYVKYDIRIRPFLCAIKYWSYQRSICDAFKGYLNTFGWILLSIKFLQTGLEIPILPIMKINIKNGKVMINKQNLNKDNKINKDTISELLSSFFEYFANFNFDKYQISITNENKYELKDVDKFSVKPHQTVWIIQHPLIKQVNVSTSVKKWTSHLMKQQLSIASDTILSSSWNILTQKISDKTQTLFADPEYKESCLQFRNLRYDVNKQHIKKFVSRIAKPISIIMSSYKSGRHIGKCYVAFKSPQIAHNVMAELNGNLLFGRPVIILFAPIQSIQDDHHQNNDDNDQEMTDTKYIKPINPTRKIRLIGQETTNLLID